MKNKNLVGAVVEWIQDCRPMPDSCMGDSEACFDPALIFRRTGTIVAVSRTFFGAWKCLIRADGGFKNGLVEKDVCELSVIEALAQRDSEERL